jgi:serine/threonine protein kinase
MSKIYPQVLTPSQLRSHFKQVLQAVQYLHSCGIAHNDIKLENIFLFGGQQIAKLADFGFARDINTDRHASGEAQRLHWQNRCKTMLAPEILSTLRNKATAATRVFDEFKADMFAFGVTLFQSLFLRTPFAGECATESDALFRNFYSSQKNEFWAVPEIVNIVKFLQKFPQLRLPHLIDLLNGLLTTDPLTRLTADEAAAHPWFYNDDEYTAFTMQ